MNKETLDKLRKYALAAGAAVAGGHAADAQILYTDVDPDETFSGNTTYNLDLNNDGTTDFGIQAQSFSYNGYYGFFLNKSVSIYPVVGNQVLMQSGSYYYGSSP